MRTKSELAELNIRTGYEKNVLVRIETEVEVDKLQSLEERIARLESLVSTKVKPPIEFTVTEPTEHDILFVPKEGQTYYYRPTGEYGRIAEAIWRGTDNDMKQLAADNVYETFDIAEFESEKHLAFVQLKKECERIKKEYPTDIAKPIFGIIRYNDSSLYYPYEVKYRHTFMFATQDLAQSFLTKHIDTFKKYRF